MIPFGKIIGDRRRALKIPQQDLADACGFAHRAEICKLESGLLEWKLWHIMAIAPLLEVPAWELIKEWEDATAERLKSGVTVGTLMSEQLKYSPEGQGVE